MYVKEPNEYEFFPTYERALQCCIRRHITLTNVTGRWEVTQVPQPDILKTKHYQHWTVRINDDTYQIVETDCGVFWVWNGTISVTNYDSGADYRPVAKSPPVRKKFWMAVRKDDPKMVSNGYLSKSDVMGAFNMVQTLGGEYRSVAGTYYCLTTYNVEVQE